MPLQSVRYALRQLRKHPGTSIVALLALALGIGANTAIFSVVHSVLLRPLPFPEPDRIHILSRLLGEGEFSALSGTKFDFYEKAVTGFSAMAAWDVAGSGVNLSGEGLPEHLRSIRVSRGFFDVFGIPPLIGRTFIADETKRGGPKSAILSHGLWQRRFGADPAILGKPVTLSGDSYSVVGVLPAGFTSDPPADIYLPAIITPAPTDNTNMYYVAGRLRPSVTDEALTSELNLAAQRGREQLPQIFNPGERARHLELQTYRSGNLRTPLLMLLGAVAAVLLIACANVANLLLARATVRRREITIRAALGANARQIITQLLAESLALSLSGGVLGIATAWAGLLALRAAAPASLPFLTSIPASQILDWRILGFALGISVLTGLLFGIVPAVQAARQRQSDTLHDEARGNTGGATGRLRDFLAIGEIAVCLVLLTGAGLLLRTYLNLRQVRPGFDPSHVLTLRMSLAGGGMDSTAKTALLFDKITRRLETLPGIEAAAPLTSLPFESGPDLPYLREGDNRMVELQWRMTGPKIFDALRVPIRRGRAILPSDTASAEPVAVISETAAAQLFGDQDPIGRLLRMPPEVSPDLQDRPRKVVGVTAGIHETGLRDGPSAVVFIPAAQVPDTLMRIVNSILPVYWVIRTSADPMAQAPQVQREILSVTQSIPVTSARSMEMVMGETLAMDRFQLTVLSIFALLAATLAASGIYGVLSYSVTQRSREIGIRMALGATKSNVLRMVLWRALTLAGIGAAAGLCGAWAVTRWLRQMLYNVDPADPITFAAVALAMGIVTIAAALAPARRAAVVDPISAIRAE